MPISGLTITEPRTGVFPSTYQEKAQTKLPDAPAAKNLITKEKLQHALEEAVKTLSPASETPAIAEGGNLDESTKVVSDKANVIGFFNSTTGIKEKFKSQAKLTFPITCAFVEKLFNKQKHTLKDAFATFDGIHSYLKEDEYKKLPDFEKVCGNTPDFKENLENMETALESIKGDFHDKSIYEIPEGASDEETQAWHDKRARVEKGLASLGLTIKNLDSIIESLKTDKVLSEEQSLGVRMITSVISGIGYVITVCGGVGAPVFGISLLTSLGVETTQYSRKQEIKKWESFKKRLEGLRDKNPLTEDKVMNQVLADNYRNQTTIKELLAGNNQTQTENKAQLNGVVATTKEVVVTLDEMQTKLNAAEARAEASERQLKEVKAQLAQMAESQTKILRLLESGTTIRSVA